MLITVSGMVGSGKSTAAKRLLQAIEAAGLHGEYVRFRFLGGSRRSPTSPSVTTQKPASTDSRRAAGFQMRRLTAPLTAGYLARTVRFRLFGPSRSSKICYVLDRYFYDNLAHYRLDTRLERAYAKLLRWAIPRPDLAVLLLAPRATIQERRPDYAREYIDAASTGYEHVRQLFPTLIDVRTDADASTRDAVLLNALHSVLNTSMSGGRRNTSAGAA